jgi:exodeoxyribonuclease X
MGREDAVDVLSVPWPQVPWVVVDVEGNGQRPPDLVELACLPIDAGRPGPVRTWLVRPPRPIQRRVTRVHGISNADVASAPPMAAVAEEIRAALADRAVVGQAVHVDIDVLGRELPGWEPPATVDTRRLAKALLPGYRSYGLDALARALGVRAGPDVGPRHRAGHDATLTAGVFLALAAMAEAAMPVSGRELVSVAAQSSGRSGDQLF